MEQGGVYDPGSNTLMVYGGDNCNNVPFSDVWVLSNANGVSGTPTWRQLSPAPAPQARRSFGTVYDPVSNELIIFGGYNDSGGYFNDVWVLSVRFLVVLHLYGRPRETTGYDGME
jgi:hypothetical protein